MTPFLTMPSIQTQLPVQTSAVVGMPTQISTIKLPIDAVPSTLQAEPVYNNTRGSGQARLSGSLGAASIMGGNSTLMPLMAGLDFRPSVQFSSPFLTQLFAQTPGSQLQAMTQFFVNDNTPKSVADPALMALYSQVKYKPSNASIPLPDSRQTLDVMQAQQQRFMQQLTEQKQQMIQSQIRSEPASAGGLRQSLVQASFQATPPRFSQPETPGSTQTTRSGSPFGAKTFRSLVQPTGIDAYIASFSRNLANLTAQPDAVRVAL